MTLFRAGEDNAFDVIHDRYRGLLLTYVRHVLGASHADAEDVLQDVFVRAYRGLRAHDRTLNLSPWLYRVARNACIDELRRRVPVPHAELPHDERTLDPDPVLSESIRRERLGRLLSDLQQLPEQQRSALLLCELSGMSYADVADTLGTSVSAVKSLLVRARLGLAQLLEARETACSEIRDELAGARARGQRPTGLARRHVHDCQGCRKYDVAMRDRKRELAALTPAVAPLAALAKLFGGGAGTGAAAAGGAGGTGAASGGLAVSAGVIGANAAHVLTVLAATTIVAAGAIGIKDAAATHASASPSTPVHPAYERAAPAGPTAATVPGSLRAAAVARAGRAAASHHAAAASSNAMLGSGKTSASGTAAPVLTSASPSASAAPATTGAPTSSKSSSSSCPIGQQSCAAGTVVTSTTNSSSTPTGSTSSELPLGSGGSPISTGDRLANVTTTPIGGDGSAGAAPPTSSSSESSQPLGSSTSPPLGS
ncbi:MAG TPA: sigma-70 family RNA polymerase sigma factor [Solirubrobacteraceae bacterium]|nr:sigma-70 family RNA polymerase sigma factor [Solirubrobacteraceae bacterium]